MTLNPLQPFTAALRAHAGKAILPTNLGSAQLRGLDAAVRRQSLFSAKTVTQKLLEGYKSKIESIINPVTQQRADRVTPENPEGNVTVGLNPTYARAEIKDLLRSLGYQPTGDVGGVSEIASDARINLVIKTNTELAQGAGRFIQSNDADVLDEFPAQELYRLEETVKQRDWEARWRAAAAESGDSDAARVLQESGRMVALKASPIWDSLGDGAGGYEDTLGNPYPPFAFSSGMWTQSVARADAEELGLIQPGQRAQAHPLDLAEIFATP